MRLVAQRFLALFALLCVAAPPIQAQIYEQPALAASAAKLQADLKARYARGVAPQQVAAQSKISADAAKQMAEQRRWADAIVHYERAIGLTGGDAQLWLDYSYALGAKRPPDYPRALDAAYLALKSAGNPKEKARALYFLGFWFEQTRRIDEAIAAYEDSLKAENNTAVRSRLTETVMRHRHQLMQATAQVETDRPRLCLTFSRNLVARDPQQFAQYVAIEPAIQASYESRDRTLCIAGVTHGQSYKVTVRQGLPAADGMRTLKAETVTVAVPDRAATVGFRGRSYILPRTGRQAVPLTTINVDRVQLRLYRINDRNLVHEINDGRIRGVLSSYDARKVAEEIGESVWSGSMTVPIERNREVTAAVPIGDILKSPRPGIYVLLAKPAAKTVRADGEGERDADWSTQWLVLTDLGVSTFSGADGLTVHVRSYETAQPRAGATVRLIARNNEVLGTATTDSQGRAAFAAALLRGTGGSRAAAVMLTAGDGEFSFLDITRPAFDLTDRGVGGRAAPGPVDGFAYTERGIYRPGETVHATVLLRDANAIAVAEAPVTLRLIRPDGVEAQRFVVRGENAAAAFAHSIALPRSAATGTWRLQAHFDARGPALATTSFQVEDFVPERMEMTLTPDAQTVEPNKPVNVRVDGRFLYGAPAADLAVETELLIRQDMRPYPEFEGYVFGLVQQSLQPKRIELPEVKTDAQGRVMLPIRLTDIPDTTRPLKAELRVSLVEEGGRSIERTVSLPIRNKDLVLGVKLESEDGTVPEGRPGAFSIIALDRAGKRRAADGLKFELVREVYEYQWYHSDGRWNYRGFLRDEPVREGTLAIAADRPAALTLVAPPGRYRLEVRDERSGAAASIRYFVGWSFAGEEGDEVPDKLAVRLDKASYRAGETAKVSIRPPFDGIVHIVVASDRVLASRHEQVPRDGKTIDIAVEENWGSGVYVLATAYRPMAAAPQRGPSRAIGLAYLQRDLAGRVLDVAIAAPEKIEPRRKQVVNLTIGGAAGEPVFVTLAAVDEGILSLTGFKTPSPDGFFYGKRRLGLELRDDYGRLIDPSTAAFGQIRQGGDAAGRHLGGLDASSIKTVALFSGIVRADADGKVAVTLDVPDFNGRLRLMAVAWTKSRHGKAERALTVRDPVVTLVTLPRFLAPGDQGRVTVSVHNVDGTPGPYRAELAATGGAATVAQPNASTLALARDQRATLPFVLNGTAPGTATVTLTVSGPQGFSVTRSFDIAVRPAQTTVTSFTAAALDKGQNFSLPPQRLAEFLPGTAKVALTAGSAPDFGLADLLISLDRYAYWCAEQTTSRALPLLYLSDVARSLGLAANDTALRANVQNMIQHVLTLQQRDGSFAMWSAADEGEQWTTVYVMDFLSQAKAQGYLVPDMAFGQGLDRLEAILRDTSYEPNGLTVLAYAHLVLAQNRRGDLAGLRYIHDTYLKDVPTALAKAQIAAALAAFGDMARAKAAFDAARAHDSRPVPALGNRGVRDYGSMLRDRAAVLHLASMSQPGTAADPALVEAIVTERRRLGQHLSTQEQAWLLLAAYGHAGRSEAYSFKLGSQSLAGRGKPYTGKFEAAGLAQGLSVTNEGDGKLWLGVSVSGIPIRDLPAETKGLEIKRAYYTLAGKPADLTKVRQSDVLVAVVRISAKSDDFHEALIVDLLPAGFEIENPRLGARSTEDMKWLPKLAEPRYVERRDDRYVAALDIGGKEREYTIAYIVRAVSPGTFRVPAAFVEDMYAPAIYGRDAIGRVTVTPRN